MTPGQAAYEAYAEATGGKNFLGDDMPDWDDLPVSIRTAWEHAALHVIREWGG